MITLMIKGKPVPQGRPRFRIVQPKGKAPFASCYDPAESRAWKEEIKRQAIASGHQMLEGALSMELTFHMLRPKSLPKKIVHHMKKPDVDNLAKAVKDGMEGVFYKNDSQVCSLRVRKVYCLEHPGVQVRIEPMEMPF